LHDRVPLWCNPSVIGALLGGEAVHWFVGGEYAAHTPLRNGLVAVQLAAGLGASLWYAWQARGAATGQDTTATGVPAVASRGLT
jgi:hypothetical protein